jgi:hypothetical protein
MNLKKTKTEEVGLLRFLLGLKFFNLVITITHHLYFIDFLLGPFSRFTVPTVLFQLLHQILGKPFPITRTQIGFDMVGFPHTGNGGMDARIA